MHRKQCTDTHPLFHMIELSKHEVYIDEDNGESKDQVIDIAPDGTGSNITKTVGNIHLQKMIITLLCQMDVSASYTSTLKYFGSISSDLSNVWARSLSNSSVPMSTISPVSRV